MSSKTRVHVGADAPALNAESYDFRRPMTLAREHSRALEMAFETYARQWSMQLTSRLRVLCAITLERLELITYDNYVDSLDPHTVMVLMSLEEARPNSIVQISSQTTMLWIDYLLGGPGLAVQESQRELTEIEHNLIVNLLGNTMTDLRYAFAAVHSFSPSIRTIQYSPQFVQAVPAKEAVLVARFEMVIGGTPSQATIMIPADTLIAPLRAGEGAEARTQAEELEAQNAGERIKRAMAAVPTDVAVRFKPLTIHPRDAAAFEVGQVIRLNHQVTRPLEVVVADRIIAHGVPGKSGSQLACKVVSTESQGVQ
ncbi:flagellar motor switch protein FliM [Timonella senegalensis]|uniref:flagellar motor switch protein FliM n=1 Tax=Timonella senegalensis TaxID=1465825 RepID=UPI002FDE6210